MPGDDLAVIQVQHGRQVQLLPFESELRHIGDPFLVRGIGVKIALQEVRCDMAVRPLVRAISLTAQVRGKALFSHELTHGFMVERVPLIAQRQGDPPITIAPLVVMKQRLDPLRFMLIGQCSGTRFHLPIEGAAWQPCDMQQNGQLMVLP